MVMRTALVNGSAFSSQARSSSVSALTTPPRAVIRTSSTANCFLVSATYLPSRKTSRRNGSSRIPAHSMTGGVLSLGRRASERSRTTSSFRSKGFVR